MFQIYANELKHSRGRAQNNAVLANEVKGKDHMLRIYHGLETVLGASFYITYCICCLCITLYLGTQKIPLNQ